MKNLTIKEAKVKLAPYGVALVKNDGEFRVRIVGSPAGHGYFTNDIEDAVNTGITMAVNANAAGFPTDTRPFVADMENYTFGV